MAAKNPAEKAKEVALGALAPLKVAKVPPFIGTWAAMGAGLIWASMAQGSGELIWWPYMTAKYGAAFIGLLLPACIMQYFVNQEINRYTATTGEGLFQGFARLHKVFAWAMWIMMIVSFAWFGGYLSGGATGLFELTGFPPGWSPRAGTLFWSYLMMVVYLAALVFGRVVYKVIERFMEVVVVVCIVGLVAAVARPEVLRTAGSYFAAYFTPIFYFPAEWDPADTSKLLTCICFAGMGGFFNVMYSYWIRDKGIGMAAHVGRITSPITGEPEAIPEVGYAFEDTTENKKNYLEWIKYLRIDNLVAVGLNLLTVTLMCWLAWALLLPARAYPTGWKLVVTQSRFFEVAWGPIGRAIWFLIAAAFLGDTWLGITDSCARMHADFFYSVFAWARKYTFRSLYYVFVAILTVISAITMLLAKPGPLLVLGGVFNFISMAIYCPALIYMNYVMIPKKFPKWTRPTNWALALISIVSAIYLILSIWYLTVIF